MRSSWGSVQAATGEQRFDFWMSPATLQSGGAPGTDERACQQVRALHTCAYHHLIAPPKQSAHRRKGTRLPSAPKSDQICREFPPSMTGNSPPRGPVRLGDYHRSVPSTPTTPFVRLTVGTSAKTTNSMLRTSLYFFVFWPPMSWSHRSNAATIALASSGCTCGNVVSHPSYSGRPKSRKTSWLSLEAMDSGTFLTAGPG